MKKIIYMLIKFCVEKFICKVKFNFLLSLFIVAMIPKVINAQIAINTSGNNPHSSAAFDIDFIDKGLLIPRVALTQTTSSSPITSPATSLLVYNTATINDVTPGYYYWNGSRWIRIAGNGSCNTANYVLKSNGTDAICSQIFDNGTNVGIGTTSPLTKLDVVGNILATNGGIRSGNTNNWANHDIFVAAITEHPSFVGLRARGTLASPVYPSTNDILLTVTGRDMIDGYNGYGGNPFAFGGGAIEFRAAENFSGTNKGSYITFNTTNIGSNIQTEKMRITANGDVGIGTGSPIAKLDVRTTAVNVALLALSDNQKTFQIGVGTNFAGVNNPDGIVAYDISGNEFHMFGGHVIPEAQEIRDLGTNTRRWRDLYVYDVYFSSVGNWFSAIYSSDERFKKEIKPLNEVSSKVLKMNPVSFKMRTEEFPDKHLPKGNQIGFIAQELEKLFPEFVNTNDEGYKTIDYGKLTTILVKAFQEQNLKIEELENKLKQIEKQNAELKDKLNSLQNNTTK